MHRIGILVGQNRARKKKQEEEEEDYLDWII
jgi:hypothetical protein